MTNVLLERGEKNGKSTKFLIYFKATLGETGGRQPIGATKSSIKESPKPNTNNAYCVFVRKKKKKREEGIEAVWPAGKCLLEDTVAISRVDLIHALTDRNSSVCKFSKLHTN